MSTEQFVPVGEDTNQGVKEKEKWTKISTESGNSVAFLCDVNGVNISILSGSVGVVIKMTRDKSKSIPVLRPDFCDPLDKLLTAAEKRFSPIPGKYIDSVGFFGRSHESTLRLNQRDKIWPTIYIRGSFEKPGKLEYTVTESFVEYDITYAAMLEKVSDCFSKKRGWKKSELTFYTGWKFEKDNIELELYKDKLMDKNYTYLKVSMLEK